MATEIKQTCKLQQNKYILSTSFHDRKYERGYEGKILWISNDIQNDVIFTLTSTANVYNKHTSAYVETPLVTSYKTREEPTLVATAIPLSSMTFILLLLESHLPLYPVQIKRKFLFETCQVILLDFGN